MKTAPLDLVVNQVLRWLLIGVVTAATALPVWAAETPSSASDSNRPPVRDVNRPTFLYPTADSMDRLYQPYLPNLEPYQPIYFDMGTNAAQSKFQFSLKYRPLNEKSPLGRRYPWMTRVHVGYTQTSFWDLKAYSAPFIDTSYKPEVHYLTDNIADLVPVPHAEGVFLRSGFQHESNGKDGLASRSTNFAYVKPMVVFYEKASGLGLSIAPRIWAYVENDPNTNPDLPDYRGYFDLEVKLGQAHGLVAGTHFWWGSKGASTQLDFTYPMSRLLGGNLDLYLHVQYVYALAESLLHYKDRTNALRVGFAIVR
jgi:phospholipase A1/A2